MENQRIDTVVIGGGQAGLATSYHLSRQGRGHVVFEQAAQAGNAWRNGRWDSFTLVTPNWCFGVPGAEYQGSAPSAFMPRDEVVARFERYVDDFGLPVRYGTRVASVEPNASEVGYLVQTADETIEAANVVVATGLFQQPKVPPMSADIPSHIAQMHSGQYRNPAALREGAVLVVGSAQSGSQIAQELYQHGRQVYLAVSGAGRVPRRYRGKDIVEWFELSGFADRTVDVLPSPRAKFASNPQASGRDGGQNINLHQFVRDGVVLLGHMRGVEGDAISLAPDLKESLTKTDEFEAQIIAMIDGYIAKAGLEAPAETLPVLADGFSQDELSELDLGAAGITTIVWATGYSFDFSMVKLPVFDADGFPVQQRGVTPYPGLFFVGLPWLYKWKSGLLMGVGDDAEFISAAIAARA